MNLNTPDTGAVPLSFSVFRQPTAVFSLKLFVTDCDQIEVHGNYFRPFSNLIIFRWLSPGFIFLNFYFSFLMLCNGSEKCSLRLAFCNQIIGGGILVHNP